MKQKLYQQYVCKIYSSDILNAPDNNLIITPKSAREDEQIISLADSNVLRSIDELNGSNRETTAALIKNIRKRMSELDAQTTNLVAVRNERRKLYAQLDEIQFKKDYIMVVMDKKTDFDKLNKKGFKINGIEFKRLVGTTNGVKQSTVVYCSVVNEKGVHIYEELEKRLNGGRDESKELIPAKYEAYKSLACSASVPVSMPKDILVVDDFVLKVKAKYIQLEDSETSDEPIETYVDGEVELNASDGFGMMLPSLAKRWSSELELDYTAGGMCIRNLFCKGMVYTFDFKEFARRYYDSDTITDVWGTVHNIDDVELILPVSVMKLWDSYSSLAHYLKCCEEFHHGFAVTKTCDKKLKNEQTLNYQFIQSYELTDEEITELIMPTLTDIKETIYGNADKTVLFLHGDFPDNYRFAKDDYNLVKALMIKPELAGDPYIVSFVKNILNKKIKQAKYGKLKVHGNFCVIGGDPFAFCQSIFKCDVPDEDKGLLKAGEIYSKYWIDDSNGEGKRVVCFRAPMSCHANILAMNVVHNDEIDYWYQYMATVNIINVHDMFYPATCGSDNDGDQILTTDNKVMLDKWRNEPAILCVQKKGQKSIITPENLAKSNKNGFGNAIGAITNRVTAMYDIMASFPPDSEQRKILEYRIRCGQQFQQAAIDKIKGIMTKPMPPYWYTWSKVKPSDTDTEEVTLFKEKNREIVANKKPYFMTYIYSDLNKRMKKSKKNTKFKAIMDTNMLLEKLLEKSDLSEDEKKFVDDYYEKCPVTDNKSTMNRLCHMAEKLFKRLGAQKPEESIDFVEILSSGTEWKLDGSKMKKLRELYEQYKSDVKDIGASDDKDEKNDFFKMLQEDFKRQALDICPDKRVLCDALLKICYKSKDSKKFVWEVCGEQIVENLLYKYGSYTYYIQDDEGTVEFHGRKYQKVTRSAFEDGAVNKEDFEIEFEEDENDEYNYYCDE